MIIIIQEVGVGRWQAGRQACVCLRLPLSRKWRSKCGVHAVCACSACVLPAAKVPPKQCSVQVVCKKRVGRAKGKGQRGRAKGRWWGRRKSMKWPHCLTGRHACHCRGCVKANHRAMLRVCPAKMCVQRANPHTVVCKPVCLKCPKVSEEGSDAKAGAKAQWHCTAKRGNKGHRLGRKRAIKARGKWANRGQ